MRVLILGASLLFALAACGGDDHSGQSQKLDHAGRTKYQDFWNSTLGNLAMVSACADYATKAVGQGDSVQAYEILQQCQKFAEDAKSETLTPPDAWSTSDSHVADYLFGASDKLSDAMVKLRAYLDDNRPSEVADATGDVQEAASDIAKATYEAKTSYVKMGGKASDLESFQSKVATAQTALHTLMAHSQ
jgi:hypothetical protein